MLVMRSLLAAEAAEQQGRNYSVFDEGALVGVRMRSGRRTLSEVGTQEVDRIMAFIVRVDCDGLMLGAVCFGKGWRARFSSLIARLASVLVGVLVSHGVLVSLCLRRRADASGAAFRDVPLLADEADGVLVAPHAGKGCDPVDANRLAGRGVGILGADDSEDIAPLAVW